MTNRFLQLFLVGFICWLMTPNLASGQMFSVQEDRMQRKIGPSNRIYIGLEPSDFSYFGPEETQVRRTRFDMESPILRVRYESRFSELFLAYGDDFTGSDRVAFFHVGGNFARPLPLHMSKSIRLYLPLRIQADLTTASSEQAFGEEFQQSNILIGAGFGFGVTLAPDIRWTGQLIPHLGYSLSPGGTFGGVAYQLSGQTRFFVDHIFEDVGLSLGYDYTFKRFDLSVERFNYKLRSHSLLIGVTF